jgi:drug/metabolite transporter (DMT)-like permease
MFGLSSICYKIFYSFGLDTNSICLYASLFPTISLFCYKLLREKNLKFLKISGRDFLLSFVNVGILGLFLVNFSIASALQYNIPVGIQQLITNSSPIAIILIELIIFRQIPRKPDILSSLLILVGLYLLVGSVALGSDKNTMIGLVFCFISLFGVVNYSTILGKYPIDCDEMSFWFYSFLGYFFGISTKLLLTNELNSIIPFANLGQFCFVFTSAIFSCTLPYMTSKRGMMAIGLIKNQIITALAPIVSLVLGIILFNEKITYLQLFGAFLILISPLLSIFFPKKVADN